jgi:hypothetical protein
MSGAYSLVVVCEAVGDHRVASGLADRVLCGEVDWIDTESLDLHRRWQGLDAGSSHIEWRRVRSLAKQYGLKVWGKFSGESGAPDAKAARLVLQLLLATDNLPDAVLLIRDSDGDEERHIGLEQARSERHWPFPIAIGLAHVNRECWVLAGFEPQGEDEQRTLADLEKELGFDPRSRSHALRGKPGEPRHAKLVLQRLVGNDKDREEACWTGCALETLKARGAETGLADYLDEVRSRIVPLFADPVR